MTQMQTGNSEEKGLGKSRFKNYIVNELIASSLSLRF